MNGGAVYGHMDQPSLLEPGFVDGSRPKGSHWEAVAEVVIDSPLPHLDRLFDYGIPEELLQHAVPGVRVSVRFAGKITDGIIVGVRTESSRENLKPLRRVVSDLPVATDEILALAGQLAQRYAGGLADVLRLAIPPRHATTERAVLASPATPAHQEPLTLDPRPWEDYPAGEAYLKHLSEGASPRAVWSALPTPGVREGQQWARAIASATLATLLSGRGVLITVPTNEDVHIIDGALREAGIRFVILTADLGPAARYENFLRILRGEYSVVLGTRAAVYAPVGNLGLVVCWDEPNHAYVEPRSPYPHARDTLALRAGVARAGALFGGFSRTPQAQHFVATGWAHSLNAPREIVRRRVPRVSVPDEYDLGREGQVGKARIPSFAWRKITAALERGPVLLQVPRSGHAPGFACRTCMRTARCGTCSGPLHSPEGNAPVCQWCARPARDWRCPHCRGETMRARSIGAQRTAQELGRAFPGVAIHVSGSGAGRISAVGPSPALIIATPGAEPPAEEGYALAVLLDARLLTDLPLLTAPTSAVHRWMRAGALTAGEVLILGEPLNAPAQAVVRWDPAGFAQRELSEWSELGFPPAHTVVSITGERAEVVSFQRYLPDLPGMNVLGPAPLPGEVLTPAPGGFDISLRAPQVRLLLRVPASMHLELTTAVRSALRTRAARRDGRLVKVKVNPVEEL